MPPRTLVIVNPRSRSGATGSRWREIEDRLRAALGPLEVAPTSGPRDAARLAREGVRAGVERLVVAGGDGTVSEVATGLLAANLGADAQIGLLPLGTGGDLVKTLGIPRDLDAAIRCLVEGKPRRLDAGSVRFRAPGGGEARSFFANVASAGISGLVVKLVRGSSSPLGGTAAFLTATLRALVQYRASPIRVRVDGEVVHEGPLLLAAAANGRYFGGGMRIAPGARPDDGLFDVVLVESLPLGRLLAKLPLIYRGRHFEVRGIHHRRGRLVELDADAGETWIELDGEPLGTLPARIELLPGALTLLGPAG